MRKLQPFPTHTLQERTSSLALKNLGVNILILKKLPHEEQSSNHCLWNQRTNSTLSEFMVMINPLLLIEVLALKIAFYCTYKKESSNFYFIINTILQKKFFSASFFLNLSNFFLKYFSLQEYQFINTSMLINFIGYFVGWWFGNSAYIPPYNFYFNEQVPKLWPH